MGGGGSGRGGSVGAYYDTSVLPEGLCGDNGDLPDISGCCAFVPGGRGR